MNCHGMRCLIDQPIQSRKSANCTGNDPYTPDTVYWTSALVLNRDEIPFGHVPESFTLQTDGWPNYHPTGEHRWTIQGNDRARWAVEL